MCIPVPVSYFNQDDLSVYSNYLRKGLLLYLKIMSLQKKNVINGFIREEFVPTREQFLVKYTSGKGNNLHEVECFDGSSLLVSMPKKYRQTVWLKKDDCLVIETIEEGKKVKGEIICLLPDDVVRDLITNRRWPVESDSNGAATDIDALLKFFDRRSDRKPKRDEFDLFPSSSSESSDIETEEDEENDDDEDGGENESSESVRLDKTMRDEDANESESMQSHCENVDDFTRDRNRSRVQLVTSGIVTVTNVLSEGLENDIQSLEFEADEEEECSDDETKANNRDIHRHANTIRIQVNYNNAN